jgi:Ca-activated chloride channel homolog
MRGHRVTGRHQTAHRRVRRGRLSLLIGVVILAVLAVVLALVLPTGKSHKTPAAAKNCTRGVALTVTADPSIASAIEDIANQWMAGKPVVDETCPSVVVRSVDSATAAATLVKADANPPNVWIPASSLWTDRVRQQTAGLDSAANSLWLYPPIATSPLVLATTPGRAAAARAAAAGGWAKLLDGSTPVAAADPGTDSAGLATVVTAEVLINKGAASPSRQLVNSFVALTSSAIEPGASGLTAFGDSTKAVPPVVTSEQAVRATATGANAASKLVAIYPAGKAVGLDWPVAQFTPPGGDPAIRDATVAFIAHLSGASAQQRLRQAGLRDAAGNVVSGAPAAQVMRRPTVDEQVEATRTWTAAGRTSRTLVVVDLSGSMGDSIGGGQTKIQFAADAELAAISFFPSSSSLGLWGFSVDRTPTTDWVRLVPLGRLDANVGGTNRRAALVAAARKMPSITDGNTGLYATTLAAYEGVRNGFDPASVNSVVLLSDGANTDTRGVDLAGLLARLRSEHDPRRPLPIITIAVGEHAGIGTLRQISAATGGRAYTATNADDIRNVFLDAIIKAG